MAGRESLDDKLAAIRELRRQILTSEQIALLRKRIGEKSNLVVAAAAAIAGENTLHELAKELELAFDRFLVNPLKDDKLCRAKIAIVEALDKIEHQNPDVFLKAARHFQMEPVWGGSEDSAPPLRAAALIALARAEGTSSLPVLADALADPAKGVRIASAVALAAVGSESAGLLLRFKTRIRDKEPDVFAECLLGLLTIDPQENLAIVAEFLEPGNTIACEAAAMAMGRSRLAEAFDLLKACYLRCHARELRQHVLLAVAILRRPNAIDFLVDLVATEAEPQAIEALSALGIYKDDPLLRERVGSVVRSRQSRGIQAGFDEEFR